MAGDLTFITNEEGQSLKERFETLIRDTKFFDCLVGYFYTSGFYLISRALEKTEKVRVLVGIGTDRQAWQKIEQAKGPNPSLQLSHAEVKEEFAGEVVRELEEAEDKKEVAAGIKKFSEWLQSKKLEIRAYPRQHLHAKLYILTFAEGDRDRGRVITGSSNFTQAGLFDNLEFNVELKNRADYEFAKQKFEELWKNAVDVSERYIQTIHEKTWLREDITPYELYLKFLYEYFKDELNQTEEVFLKYLPAGFKSFNYQRQAVLNAKKILLEYGGVFISDVVGLGKTYMAAMLAAQLDGRTLVIAPPLLIHKNNPGSWSNVFSDFHLPADFESLGKLDDIINRGTEKYKNIIIDEAHRFRTETNVTYEKLAQITRGKRVILVTATPYNNSPEDILAQIKLFQNSRKSTIPNLPDLERFFHSLSEGLKKIKRQEDYEGYSQMIKENAKEIREKVLKYLMVRRTRKEIEKYFSDDLKRNRIKFPEVAVPKALYYEFNETEDRIFNNTIELITQKLKYARYTPMLYFKGKISQKEKISQVNMGRLMKVRLVKRLESSFFAFKKTLERFVNSYQAFLEAFEQGSVYISKKYINKIFEFIACEDDEAVQSLLEKGKAHVYASKDFRDDFKTDLENDLSILKQIQKEWEEIRRDPKLLKFLSELKKNAILNNNKLIIFSESKETATYLTEELNKVFPNSTICFTGDAKESVRGKIIANFDAKARHPRDDYRFLVATEVMAEGVNLHRSNVVINYDIPWNPTRIIQRVGRVDRVDTKFDKIYTFNFSPTRQANNEIKLKEIAKEKIDSFLTLLGGDAAILTEGEPVGSHELFNRLAFQRPVAEDDEQEESELKYLQEIREIQENDKELFSRIKLLPKKAHSAKKYRLASDHLLTYLRRAKLQKFYLVSKDGQPQELDFLQAAQILASTISEKREALPDIYFDLLNKNKEAFIRTTANEVSLLEKSHGRDRVVKIIKMLKALQKNIKGFTEEDETYFKGVLAQLEEGGFPDQTTKATLKALEELGKDISCPGKVLGTLKLHIPKSLLASHYVEKRSLASGKREIILSMYLKGEAHG